MYVSFFHHSLGSLVQLILVERVSSSRSRSFIAACSCARQAPAPLFPGAAGSACILLVLLGSIFLVIASVLSYTLVLLFR